MSQFIVRISKGNDLFEDPSESIHIFKSEGEATKFISWIQQYNNDLNIKVEEANNENDSNSNECPTFI